MAESSSGARGVRSSDLTPHFVVGGRREYGVRSEDPTPRGSPAWKGVVAVLASLVVAGAWAETPADAPAAASAASAPLAAKARIARVTAASAAAPSATPTAADPVLEARMLEITSELRCLVCQNQTIAESHADLAVDLREEVRELLTAGRTPQQIRDYMTARYGDFVLYRPPFKPTTLLLWLGPALLLAIGGMALAVSLRRRGRLADDRFEPDPALDEPEAGSGDPPAQAMRPGASA